MSITITKTYADGEILVEQDLDNIRSAVLTKFNTDKIDSTDIVSGLLPPTGMIAYFPVTSAPTGWLTCNGQEVSRSTYSTLFTLIGTTYGVGNGSTTFNLPDIAGRVIAGYDAANATSRLTGSPTGGVSASTIGNTGGAQGHVITSAQMATHTHVISDSGHTHTGTTNSGTAAITVANEGAHTHGMACFARSSANFSGSNTNFPVDAVSGTDYTSNAGSAHTHTATDSGHTHTFTTASNTTGISAQNNGSDASHNNVQPTIILLPIIKY